MARTRRHIADLDQIADDERICVQSYIPGADYKLLLVTLRTTTKNPTTGKAVSISDFVCSVLTKEIAKIRSGKRIKI